MSDLVWTVTQVAEQLGVNREIVEELTSEGRLPHVRLSQRKIVYPKKQVEEWLADEARASTVLFELEADRAHTGLGGAA